MFGKTNPDELGYTCYYTPRVYCAKAIFYRCGPISLCENFARYVRHVYSASISGNICLSVAVLSYTVQLYMCSPVF